MLDENSEILENHDVFNKINRRGGLSFSKLKSLIRNPIDRSVDFYKPVDVLVDSNNDTEDCSHKTLGYLVYITENSQLDRADVIELIESQDSVWVCCHPELSETVRVKFKDTYVIDQYEFVALSPDNKIINDSGRMFYCCGSADSVVSLCESETFKEFVSRGGENMYVMDASLSLCLPDRNLIRTHVQNNTKVTATVTEGIVSDDRAVLCDVEGSPQLLESFLFYKRPEKFDLVHTGHIIFKTDLQFDKIQWTWHRRKIMSKGTAEVHYKRYLYDLTEAYDTKFIKVDRRVYTIT